MRSRILVAALALGATALSLLPATAGQYSTQVEVLQGARAEGTLSNGGTARITLGKMQGVEFSGPGAVVPNSGTADLPTVYGSFPTATGQERPARYVGCIDIYVGTQRDGGCTIVDPSTATFDAALSTGSLSFTVRSRLVGYEVTATAILRATTNPQPVPELEPQYFLSPNNLPLRVEAKSNTTFKRTATLLGSVRSEILGGGVFRAVRAAEMFGGIGSLTVADRSMPFCMSPTGTQSKPGDMPWNEFPPKPWIPTAPSPPTINPNKPWPPPPLPQLPSPPLSPTRICPADV